MWEVHPGAGCHFVAGNVLSFGCEPSLLLSQEVFVEGMSCMPATMAALQMGPKSSIIRIVAFAFWPDPSHAMIPTRVPSGDWLWTCWVFIFFSDLISLWLLPKSYSLFSPQGCKKTGKTRNVWDIWTLANKVGVGVFQLQKPSGAAADPPKARALHELWVPARREMFYW